jgi:putative sterol carrier protein
MLEPIGPGYVARAGDRSSMSRARRAYIAPVLRFLSDEWIRAFDAALRADATLGARFAATPIAIAQDVESEPGYVVVLDGAGGRIVTDGSRTGDITFVCSRATAVDLARGDLNAQRALASGRLKLRGDVDRLGSAGDALAALGDLLAGLRADTEF